MVPNGVDGVSSCQFAELLSSVHVGCETDSSRVEPALPRASAHSG